MAEMKTNRELAAGALAAAAAISALCPHGLRSLEPPGYRVSSYEPLPPEKPRRIRNRAAKRPSAPRRKR